MRIGRNVLAASLILAGSTVTTAAEASDKSPTDPDAERLADLVDDSMSYEFVTNDGTGRASEPKVVSATGLRESLRGLDKVDVTFYDDGAVVAGIATTPPAEVDVDPASINPEAVEGANRILRAIEEGTFDPADVSNGIPPELRAEAVDEMGGGSGLAPQIWRVTPTTAFSANATGRLVFTRYDGAIKQCTAYVYGHNIVLTAAHCLKPQGHGWNGSWKFYRGQDGSNGSLQSCTSWSWAGLSDAWSAGNDGPNSDWGAVRFNCTFPGTYGTGWMPVLATGCPSTPYPTYNMWLSGYREGATATQMWEDYGPFVDTQCNFFYHSLDAIGGQSGAPIVSTCYEYGFTLCPRGHHKGDAPGYDEWAKRWWTGDLALIISWRGY